MILASGQFQIPAIAVEVYPLNRQADIILAYQPYYETGIQFFANFHRLVAVQWVDTC